MPPFGHCTQLRVFVVPDLVQYDEVWAAAGTLNDNFGADLNDIVRVSRGVVTDLKREGYLGRTLTTWTHGRTRLRTSAE